jgi:NAD(P)-dependent dehydrogenase (short-subunit alcohol dehydrogenase family)
VELGRITPQGKAALVTGASRAIGRATALALGGAGARVVIHYGKSASDAESVGASIRGLGGVADAIAPDLATPNGVTALANEACKILGDRLDVLVATAGVSKSANAPSDNR